MKRVLLAGMAMLCSWSASAQDYPALSLRYAAHVPASVYLSKVDTAFTDAVTKRTNGKVKFKHFWSNALGSEAEIVDLVSSSAIDFGLIVTGGHFSQLPLSSVTNALPMVFFDGKTAVDVTRSLFFDNPSVRAEFDRANLQPVLIRHLPEYRLLCGTPVRTLADLKGKKVRTYGSFVPIMFNALGAVPVTVPPLEMYEALQRRTVDCLYLTYATFHALKLHKAAKYLIDVNFGTINAYTLFTSRDNWRKWPEDLRKVMLDAAAESEALALKLNDDAEVQALEAMRKDGAELVRFEDQAALRKAVPDMLDVWVGKLKEQGREADGKQIADFIRSKLLR